MAESEDISPVDSATDYLMRRMLLTGDRSHITAAITGSLFSIFLPFGFAGFISLSVSEWTVCFLNGAINGLLTLIPIIIGLT